MAVASGETAVVGVRFKSHRWRCTMHTGHMLEGGVHLGVKLCVSEVPRKVKLERR